MPTGYYDSVSCGKAVIITDQQQEEQERQAAVSEAERLLIRENTKRILQESGLAEMLRAINKNLLKGRGWFEEYDSMILFKWGTGYTMRHLWVEIAGDSIRFRMLQHRKCAREAPLCDGEYHTITRAMWSDRAFLQAELKKYYDRPVAESSSD